ncbi:3-oxoacyl-[acyl-carrier-protein] synthase 3 FabH [Gordonia polyisoprenivorans VH2]|uniref:Beta-ketoacyl-[acyl-carrier-protein] synthase III n=2 Tax=Gordonia polyisoprenivorans TaxID=84595 RepID=H6N4E5_GORPV|nr:MULTISPECIES: beta-ketoacyl-ACP synthase III [Gordonia]AFA72414.1 3-oxoacyl-[acyl-carrier-protein] synthase 3 FabH [Gordonia polyisoprenivorans VH2]MBE7195016.1 ketoacyl-ACP synthase III [Gordonia polyisoprenivorans]MDF3282556.1 ketoacyl-ACP synthase III [Gordonia sp. N1V]NKY03857.1 ketoacyl-ACP synthase III [Gordonia polyisoprenivorans]OPX09348.1 ketoacyl-ACP synthase III [Gordonia sp. i37]
MTVIADKTGVNNIGMLGIGAYRPERVVTNDEICEHIDSSDEWIYTRTGIKTRRFARRDEDVTQMSVAAGRTAIANALLSGSDIDAVILATNTHLLLTPAGATKVATELGCNGVPAFDVTVGCAGFGYAMALASDMVRGGSATHVLVIGAEQLSVTLDMTDRGNCFIFGDGAGAVVVGPTEDQQLGPVIWGSDGSQYDAIRQDIDWVTFLDGDRVQRPYVRLQGTAVFRWAAFEMGKAAQRALEAAKIGTEDLDVFVPHQANSRINELLAKSLHLPERTVVANDIEYTGNTSAASIPLAMEDLLSTGKAKPGDTALLLGFGAGLSYAAQVVKMPPVPFE